MSSNRARYVRGVDTLWNEQCGQYAVGMAVHEHLGPLSHAWQQIDSALRMRADQRFAELARAMVKRSAHRVMYPAAYAGWTTEPMADRQPTDTLVPDRQADRWSLEAQANALLAAADDAMPGLDVTVRGHLQVKPDRVAYRGQVRYRRPRPCRYHEQGERSGPFVVATDGTCTPPAVLYRTDVTGRGMAFVGIAGEPAIKFLTRDPMDADQHAQRWYMTEGGRGHRVVIGTRTASVGKVARKARVKVERATTTATRGKAVSWWSMSDKSLPRWWAKADDQQRATADTLERVLRTLSHDQSVELADGHRVIVDQAAACVRRDEPNSRMMPIREYARRATLAGLPID